MSREQEAEQILKLQQAILTRLEQLGYADQNSAVRIARHLAEISVLGRSYADHTLPLLLEMTPDSRDGLSQLAVSMKVDLEEIGDAITDVDDDLRSLMEFLRPAQSEG